ncbi:MAG: M6 family metalloprotease domain-containing protein [candidate division Zixibacteria bacterium]|nr:M6 family metalloprotease domain-containing protein [candidate division Zixibacteria bacterium]
MIARYAIVGLVILTSMLLMVASAWSVAPTKEAIEKWKSEGILEEKLNRWKSFKEKGGCSPVEHSVFDKKDSRDRLATGVETIDTVKVICILVDFTDWPYTLGVAAEPYQFDSILFSDSNCDTCAYDNPTGSMTDFYMENSYGKFYVQGDIFGWYTMPETYAWYENGEDGIDGEARARDLAVHAVDMAHDSGADFSDYDFKGDGFCDGVIIIHAGRGAEEGVYGIWSHKSTLRTDCFYDGVLITNYTMNPEETGPNSISPIGVVCHEYGHFLGLPDLYDVDGGEVGSDGLGNWSLMARGNYLGASKKPAHMDAYCKAFVGFVEPIDVTANLDSVAFPAVEYNPVVYKVQYDPGEYWLIENRQKMGFDISLPGAGLLIYHVDLDAPPQNTTPSRYYVSLEQADGDNGLAYTEFNYGDAGDPFPGATHNREWHNFSLPNSRTNFDIVTELGLWEISDSDSMMYADIDGDEGYSRPWVELYGLSPLVLDDTQGGDGDDILEAGETIQFFCTVINRMRYSYNVRATLATDNPHVQFITQSVNFNTDLFAQERSNLIPIEFSLAADLISKIDSFYVTITTDSLESTPGSSEFSATFGFEAQVGSAQVLIVDDDRGESYETNIEDAFLALRVPAHTYEKAASGSPTAGDLLQYPIVFWITGDVDDNVLSTDDVAAMGTFLDNGNSLCLSTLSGIDNIETHNPAFLASYFHAEKVGNSFDPFLDGVSGTAFDNIIVRFRNGVPQLPSQCDLNSVGGGVNVLQSKWDTNKNFGVTFKGSFQTILLAFPLEYIDNDDGGGRYPVDSLLERSLQFFGGIASEVYDGQPFSSLPTSFELDQNFPNPFNPSTTISYTLRATGSIGERPNHTKLSVFNILGREVTTLVDKVQTPGQYQVEWDGNDRTGHRVGSGIYFYRLIRGDEAVTRKMVLVK